MDIEFHYWVTGLMAEYAGFKDEEPQIIAYSSQYVDDNDRTISVFDTEFEPFPSYVTHVSQTMDILLPREDIMQIYPLFHFIPGDGSEPSNRRDGKTHPLNTVSDNVNANALMSHTVKSSASRYKEGDRRGLYRLGIMTHAYVDTWSHQNFVGWFTDFNAIGSNLIPDIGHADALHHPDWVGHRWSDQRLLDPEVDNISRFLGAARKTYDYFLAFQQEIGKSPVNRWGELENLLQKIFGRSFSGNCQQGIEERLEQYRNASNCLVGYREQDWLDQAVNLLRGYHSSEDHYVDKYVWKNRHARGDTHWYNFQEAVKEHVVAATHALKPAFAKAGIPV